MTPTATMRRVSHDDSAAQRLSGTVTGFAAYVRDYLQHRAECRELLQLDDYMLKDIGLSRADAERIAGQPYRPRAR